MQLQLNNLDHEPSLYLLSLIYFNELIIQYLCLSIYAAGVFTVEGSHRREVGGYPAGLPHTQPGGSGPESEKQGDLYRQKDLYHAFLLFTVTHKQWVMNIQLHLLSYCSI